MQRTQTSQQSECVFVRRLHVQLEVDGQLKVLQVGAGEQHETAAHLRCVRCVQNSGAVVHAPAKRDFLFAMSPIGLDEVDVAQNL